MLRAFDKKKVVGRLGLSRWSYVSSGTADGGRWLMGGANPSTRLRQRKRSSSPGRRRQPARFAVLDLRLTVCLKEVTTGKASLSATDFWTGFWTLFWGPIQGWIFHRSAYKPASFPQHIETQAGFVTIEIHLPNLR